MPTKFLYHGSHIPDLERLEPRPARGVGKEADKQLAVYATHELNYAIPFALPFEPDSEGQLVWSLDFPDTAKRPRITIEAGWLNLQHQGYIYVLPQESFTLVDAFQWVSQEVVEPMDVFPIDPMQYRFWVEGIEPDYTDKQGQYLAFIYYYTKLNDRAPAQADIQKYFRTTPPSIHQMILTLERRGFISRVPGEARSLELMLSREQLPDLE